MNLTGEYKDTEMPESCGDSTLISVLMTLALLMSYTDGIAQVNPIPGSKLNYTSVLFTFPPVEQAESYQIQISESPEFVQVQIIDCEVHAKIISSLAFGRTYYWRYVGLNVDKKLLNWSEIYQFSVGFSELVDDSLYRYRGRKKDRKSVSPGVLFLDYGRVVINRGGRAIWYLPEFPFLKSSQLVRDLKLTNEGTITALLDSTACEFDLNGNILWKAPDDGKVNGENREHYHHDFKKLSNGNYMVLGLDYVFRKIPGTLDSVNVEFGTIIEYDKDGNVVWSWNSKDYFSDEDLFRRRRSNGDFDTNTHMNAFSIDGPHILAGFRDISRIIVIDKISGRVINSYGDKGNSEAKNGAAGFFRRQHDGVVLKDGNIAAINNDSVMDPAIISSMVVFTPLSKKNPDSRKILEFKFDFDTLTNGKSARMGNLQEMENSNILINMGAINRCVEISRSGEVLWDMFMEKFDTIHNQWRPFPQYRINYAEGLYPYVFRTRIIEDSIKKQTRTIQLKVYNVGNKEDRYHIELFQGKDPIAFRHEGNSLLLQPDDSAIFTLSFREIPDLHIQVRSGNSLIAHELSL